MKNVKSGHIQPWLVLDAGHYGKYNRSPVVKGYYESEAMWKLHLLLKEELEKRGIKVTTTRDKQDKDVGLKARGKASKGADLLLSLHSNAANSESVDYVVAYHLYPDDGTQIDDQSKELAGMLAPAVAKVMGVSQSGRTATRKGSGDWNGDGKLNDNYYSVLNGARLVGTPGIILEHSFHTNPDVAKWLMQENNLRKLAKSEADVIADYFGIAPTVTKTIPVELPVLKRGMKNSTVWGLQALLLGRGYDLGEKKLDGSFGAATETALKRYQFENDLQVDGCCGRETWNALLGLY